MIKIVSGSLFDQEFDIRVNTVNTVGVMGKGVALEFKKRYPKMFRAYKVSCHTNQLLPGSLMIWNNNGEHIVNFATKDHWRNPSKYQYIKEGLKELKTYLSQFENIRVGIPALGCGYGGLKWDVVSKLIEKELSSLNLDIYLFEPSK
jgi:O-acetyl-ADP-ribose deacetylase (regulator of RNase III)